MPTATTVLGDRDQLPRGVAARIKSASLWPAAILHASHNLYMQSVFTPLTVQRGEITNWMGGDLGVVFTVAAVVVAVVTYFGFRKRLPSQDQFAAANR